MVRHLFFIKIIMTWHQHDVSFSCLLIFQGLYTLTSYDTLTCASKCDRASGCSAFNMYLERDPTVNASVQNCNNPKSTTNYKCTLWGAPVSSEEATNSGQYQASFHVVIAGSNGEFSFYYDRVVGILISR